MKDDGGPAFPRYGVPGEDTAAAYSPGEGLDEGNGMSLRDWFAGQALGALVAAEQTSPEEITLVACENIAVTAYQVADAMLEARKQ